MSEKKKLKKWQKIRIFRICLLVSFILAFAAVLLLIRSGYIWPVQPAMSQDISVSLRKADDGWHTSWTEGEYVSRYTLEILRDSNSGQSLFNCESESNECILPPDLPEKSNICLRITPIKQYSVLGIKGNTVDGDPVEMTFCLRETDRYVPEWYVDAERKTLTVGCAGGGSDIYHLYRKMDSGELKEISRLQYTAMDRNGSGYGEMVVGFGDDRDFPMPETDEEMHFVLMAERVEENVRIWEEMVDTITVVRNDLLCSNLTADAEQLGYNRYRISFSETAGKGYRVQRRDDDSLIWDTVAEYGVDDERIYETEYLLSGKEYRYRVTSITEGSTPWSVAEVDIFTGYSPIYATIWPVKELSLYSGSDMSESIGKASVGKALCVTGEENGMFKVYRPEGDAYIDSNYCMIDLNDYLGGMCSYDITNSYFSLYMAHDHEIRGISGTVIPGYEHVLKEDGTFLVPLLYPVAKRLASVAEKTMNDGYRLKIYDSFRPYVATRYIYDATESQLDEEAPAELMQRLTLPEYLSMNYNDEEIYTEEPAPTDPEDPASADPGQPGEDSEMPEGQAEDGDVQPEGSGITYRQLMTNATYGLSFFLAKGGSMHNLGVALDLTLERRDNAEELPMQSNMHDLSYNSIQSLNSGEAKLLQTYMYDEGFGGIASEWWHFQDNDVRKQLSPPSIQKGVSAEGWKKDNDGLRYQKANGAYTRDAIETIDGIEYRFNSDGYLEQ